MERLHVISERGVSLIEVIIAIGIFSMMVTTSVGVFITSKKLERVAEERVAALSYAEDGLEAVRNIRSNDFALLVNGMHGLRYVQSGWEFSGTSDTHGIYSREVTVSTARTDTKQIVSRVYWDSLFGRKEVRLTTEIADWAKLQEAAPNLQVIASGAYIPAQAPKDVRGITLQNTGSFDITVSAITVSWTPDVNRRINAIVIGGITVWSNSGPGSPIGTQLSGTPIDIVDVLLPANGGSFVVDMLDFDGNMKGNVLSVVFTLSDGSTLSITGITPPVI